jgi:hypothetical protein
MFCEDKLKTVPQEGENFKSGSKLIPAPNNADYYSLYRCICQKYNYTLLLTRSSTVVLLSEN